MPSLHPVGSSFYCPLSLLSASLLPHRQLLRSKCPEENMELQKEDEDDAPDSEDGEKPGAPGVPKPPPPPGSVASLAPPPPMVEMVEASEAVGSKRPRADAAGSVEAAAAPKDRWACRGGDRFGSICQS